MPGTEAGRRHSGRQERVSGTGPDAMRDMAGRPPDARASGTHLAGAAEEQATVGYLAERLILKPHSASELVNRLEALQLITRQTAQDDRRKTLLALTARANKLLEALSATHREEIRRLKPLLLDLLDRFG